MTVGRIGGPMLKNNLVRQGVDLAFETNLLYLDVNNLRIGINQSIPAVTLDVNGVVLFGGNLKFTGTTIESTDTNGNITFQPNGTGSVVSTAPVYATRFISNIATGTAPFTVTSTTQVANLNAATAGTAGSATTAETVTTAAQPNITSVGTLTGLDVNGNVNAQIFNSNITSGTAPLTVQSTTQVANLNAATAGSATTAGTVTTAAQPNITSVGTLTGLDVNGTITGTQLISNIATGTAPFTVTSTTQVANLNAATAGSATTATNAGTVTTAAQPNITSVGTLTGLDVNGNVNAQIFNSNITTGTAPFTVASTTRVANLNVANAGYADNAGTVTTAAQSNITSVGTLTGLDVNGTVTASTLVSNVATGTAPFTVNSTTQVANLNAATAGSAISATTAGTVTTAAQPNITSVGTLTGLDVNGNVNAQIFNSNITTGTAPFTVVSTTQVANLNAATAGSATTAGTVTTAAQPNITSVGVLSSLDVSGNVTASQLISNITTGTAPFVVTSTTQVANLNAATAGSATTATTAGTVTTSAQPNITSVGVLSSLDVSGTVTASTLVSNIATGTAPFTVNSTTQVANLNVATAGSATTAGTVTTAAQPNITSVGTLSSLAVTGNVAVDTNVLFVDTTNNRIGINTTPNVTLDISGTDAVQLPVGNTAGRPTPAAGMIRYNSEIGSFEGYTTQWGAIGGGGGSASVTISDTAPVSPTAGDLWWDSTVGTLKIYYDDGSSSQWVNATSSSVLGSGANVSVSDTAPSTPTAGDLWWDSTVGTLKIYYDDGSSSQWVDASINSLSSTSIPAGGTTGQVLAKASAADYDSAWVNPGISGSTGSTDNRLLRADGTGGLTVQNSTITVDDSGNVTGVVDLTASGIISASQLISNISTGTAPLTVTSTTQVANLNAATAGSATTAGTVTTAAQPNITSVGTLTGLTVSGNTTVSANGITFSDASVQTTAATPGITTGKAIAMAIVFG